LFGNVRPLALDFTTQTVYNKAKEEKMLKLTVLDKNGHSTITTDVQEEFARLVKAGYAMFLDNIHITELPTEGDVLALSPLAGG
jgi:hypothetical protein